MSGAAAVKRTVLPPAGPEEMSRSAGWHDKAAALDLLTWTRHRGYARGRLERARQTEHRLDVSSPRAIRLAEQE